MRELEYPDPISLVAPLETNITIKPLRFRVLGDTYTCFETIALMLELKTCFEKLYMLCYVVSYRGGLSQFTGSKGTTRRMLRGRILVLNIKLPQAQATVTAPFGPRIPSLSQSSSANVSWLLRAIRKVSTV